MPIVADVRELLRDLQPRASVFLRAVPEGVDLDTEEDLLGRWRMLAHRMLTQGIDVPTLAVLTDHIAGLASTPVAAAGYALLASDGVIHLARPMPAVVAEDRARFATPLEVLPVLAWQERHPAYVSVLIDRVGGEVTSVPAGALSGTTQTVTGPDDEIERNAPGGWSQPRYQRRAEDSWHHNAVAVADVVIHELDRVEASLLLVAGDVRAVQMLRDYLHKTFKRQLDERVLPGGRSADGSAPAHLQAIADAVADHAGARGAALLDAGTSGPGGDLVEGAEATLTALAEGRLRTLFVLDDPADKRLAGFGEDVLCADLSQAATQRPTVTGRLVDVAVRAAILTGADVHVSTPTQAKAFDGHIGGLCRYRPATPG